MISTPTRFEALKLVIDAYVTQEAAAEAFGVCQSTVSRWLSQSKRLPAEYVLKAEADTGVPRHFLRPDIYPPQAHASHSRWLGIDMAATGSDVAVVSAITPRRNGNRIKVLDKSSSRRAVG
ncbi:YdaS family helix-turn-helix protein [Novosphingobium sp. SL115]|uniref:transcriptional regulator n=1 Tax=Novosphingobium sp. SL115 TaxID=2995150 RepID=UPI002275ADEA|nr:YdaS family helix-turn-helix protein [Novosphingobium sp. SL115]MCY1672138.1 YdaS family helix-turn-helix protein [Novosphingobium sp. SL115]